MNVQTMRGFLSHTVASRPSRLPSRPRALAAPLDPLPGKHITKVRNVEPASVSSVSTDHGQHCLSMDAIVPTTRVAPVNGLIRAVRSLIDASPEGLALHVNCDYPRLLQAYDPSASRGPSAVADGPSGPYMYLAEIKSPKSDAVDIGVCLRSMPLTQQLVSEAIVLVQNAVSAASPAAKLKMLKTVLAMLAALPTASRVTVMPIDRGFPQVEATVSDRPRTQSA